MPIRSPPATRSASPVPQSPQPSRWTLRRSPIACGCATAAFFRSSAMSGAARSRPAARSARRARPRSRGSSIDQAVAARRQALRRPRARPSSIARSSSRAAPATARTRSGWSIHRQGRPDAAGRRHRRHQQRLDGLQRRRATAELHAGRSLFSRARGSAPQARPRPRSRRHWQPLRRPPTSSRATTRPHARKNKRVQLER